MWAHEHWDLPEEDAPDVVTFAKKAQIAGFFSRKVSQYNTIATFTTQF